MNWFPMTLGGLLVLVVTPALQFTQTWFLALLGGG